MTTPSTTTRVWNVPNLLSAARMGLGVILFACIAFGAYLVALGLFLLAAISDGLDGYLARKLNQETAFGRQLDPLVDKLLIAGAYIYLLTVPGTGLAPWMVTAIVIRELLVQWLRSLLEGRGVAFGAKLSGKLKTTFQCLSIIAILLCLSVPALQTQPWFMLRDVLTWTAVGLTIYSGVVYFKGSASRFREVAGT